MESIAMVFCIALFFTAASLVSALRIYYRTKRSERTRESVWTKRSERTRGGVWTKGSERTRGSEWKCSKYTSVPCPQCSSFLIRQDTKLYCQGCGRAW